MIISSIANYTFYSTSIIVTFYVIINSGEILNRQALLSAISGGISDGNYSDAGFSVLASIVEPTLGAAEEDASSNGTNIIIGVTVCVMGMIIVLVLVLVIVIIRV